MSSIIDICNMALSDIRAGSINSLDESSLQAQQCKLHYPFVLDMVLRDAPWRFSRKIVAISLLETTVFGWKYAYQYPNDCLYINKLMLNQSRGNDSQIAYDVFNLNDSRVIATNDKDLRADYRARVSDPNLFDSIFIMAITKLLASEIAVPLVGVQDGRQLKSDAIQLYKSYISSAVTNSLNESYRAPVDSEFITARN